MGEVGQKVKIKQIYIATFMHIYKLMGNIKTCWKYFLIDY